MSDRQVELLQVAITDLLKRRKVIRDDIVMLDGPSCLMMLEELDLDTNYQERLQEIHNWVVSGSLPTPEEKMKDFPRIAELSDVGKSMSTDACVKLPKMVKVARMIGYSTKMSYVLEYRPCDLIKSIQESGVKMVIHPDTIEDKAKEIYNDMKGHIGWRPWVEGGNSKMQDLSRETAIKTLEVEYGIKP